MLELKKLVDGVVDSIPFDITLSSEGISDDIVSGSAEVKGEVVNHSGFITLRGDLVPDCVAVCGRCGREFKYTRPVKLYAKITDKLANEDEDDFVLMTDYAVDLVELARSNWVLELPFRFLCKEDCRGLCPKCGADLNVADCSCDLKERDHRWDALLGYFEEDKKDT